MTVSGQISLALDSVELIVLPPLCPLTVSPIDFSQAGQLIERARTAAGSWLDRDTPAPSHPELLLSLHDHIVAMDAETRAGPSSCTEPRPS